LKKYHLAESLAAQLKANRYAFIDTTPSLYFR
jgi:hypothetical protein